jgi:hypothetical protein
MTQDFFMGQLRLIAVGIIAYCAGKGYLSTADSTLAGAILPPIGLLFGPWLWSLYVNFNGKMVPRDSVAIQHIDGTKPDLKIGDALNSVIKVVGALFVAIMLSSFAIDRADAQTVRRATPVPVENPLQQFNDKVKKDFSAATGVKATGDLPFDLLQALDAKLLPDLQYALLLANATGDTITGDCYTAWISIITTQQAAVKDKTGADIPIPDPHLITDFERAVEIRNMLQPQSTFMTKCSPVANMVKQDVIQFMGVVISGSAGLATMVPGL